MSNWQRWNTVLPASRFVVDCWIEFYFLDVANCQSQRNGNSYLAQILDSLLAAMKTKAKKPDESAGEEPEEENSESVVYEPSLYIQLLLLIAFFSLPRTLTSTIFLHDFYCAFFASRPNSL